MPSQHTKTQIFTPNAPAPLPVYSQAIVCNGMVYCAGQIATDPATKQLVQGGVGERTRQALTNLSAVLTASGSSLANAVRIGVFLTSMDDFAAVNRVYETFFPLEAGPRPARTCVAVKELPLGTDVEVECVAHL